MSAFKKRPQSKSESSDKAKDISKSQAGNSKKEAPAYAKYDEVDGINIQYDKLYPEFRLVPRSS